MPESRVYTTHRSYPLVRKASSPMEQRDWMDEEVDFAEAIDQDVQNIYDIISGSPAAHKTSHQYQGTDALNVGGLSGALADGQKTNPDLKTLRGEGSLASKLYSAAGLQNAWEWGSRIETEDGQLLQLNHDPVTNTRTVRIVGGQSNPNLIANPDFFTNTTGWTASSGTTFIRLGLATSDWPEPFNLTNQSANQFSCCGRANKNTSAPFGVSQTGILEVGKRYRVSGWINNLSGTSEIVTYCGGVVVANATSTNEWKYFDTVITAANTDVLIQSEPTGTENSIFYFAHFRAYALEANEGWHAVDSDGGLRSWGTTGTRIVEKDFLGGVVTDTETIKNSGVDAELLDVSGAKKTIIVESNNNGTGEGSPARLTVTMEAENQAGAGTFSKFSVDAFINGTTERRVLEVGEHDGVRYHSIIAQSFLVNGEPQGVQFVTTVADTPHVMTIASAKKIIFEGSASNSPCELPAANSTETLSDGTVVTMRGRSFELVNASSEFIPVQNSGTASSVFELLDPGCTLVATCTGTSTAAGKWTATKDPLPDTLGSDYSTDFTDNSSAPGWLAQSGTGASVNSNGLAFGGAVAGMIGYHIQITGSTAPPIYQAYTRQALNIGNGAKMFRHRVKFYDAPSLTEDYTYEMGLFATVNTVEATNGIILRSPTKTSTATTWSGETYAATATTAVNTGVTVGTSIFDGAVVVNSAGTRVDFFANKSNVGNITTNIPASSAALYPGVKIVKTVGTTTRYVFIDIARHSNQLSALR